MTEFIDSLDLAVDRMLARIAGPLAVGAPLGIGKPHRLLNALYGRVERDPSRALQLYTALSLDPPAPGKGLEGRFLGPFAARHFGTDFPRLDYVAAQKRDALPANITVEEFYLQSGALLGSTQAQRHYASLDYTHVARALADRGLNCIVQKVAANAEGTQLSLSSNTDLTFDALDALAAAGARRPLMVAEIDPLLPWLGGPAAVSLEFFDIVVAPPAPYPKLFALPRQPVGDAEHAIGLYASALVRDGGTLQVGIGTLSDALCHALVLRHTDNTGYRRVLQALDPGLERLQPAAGDDGGVPLEFRIERLQHAPVRRVVGVAQHQRMAQRVRQRADADLQRAAVANQRAGVQADRVFGVTDRLPRQREQLRKRRRWRDHDIEEVERDRGRSAEPRQQRIDLRHHQRTRRASGGEGVERVEGQVGVRRQRKLRAFGIGGDLLHDAVQAAVGQRPCDVGVVQARVVALRLRRTQQRARLHVELFDRDVGRQRVALLRGDVVQAREVVAEMTRHERPEEAAFEPGARRGRIEGKRGVQLEHARRVPFDAPVQHVEQPVRLADAERRADGQWPGDAREHAIDGEIQRIDEFGHPGRVGSAALRRRWVRTVTRTCGGEQDGRAAASGSGRGLVAPGAP